MELHIAGTNTEISSATQSYVKKKLSKLSKHLPDIIDIKVEISEEKTRSPEQHYLVRTTVSSGVGAVFHGEERAEDLYKAVDGISSIMTRQLERHKGKLYEKGRGNSLARSKFSDAILEDKSYQNIVKIKRFSLEPMLLDEAIERMEELGHSFFLFLDADSDAMKLLYRRKDEKYGLIEPVV